MKDFGIDIYEATLKHLEEERARAKAANYSPEKQREVDKAFEEAEAALANLKKSIDNPFLI